MLLENAKHVWFKLSKRDINILFFYYTILIVVCVAIGVYYLLNYNLPHDVQVFRFALMASSISSVLGASIFYCRKLYKACINNDVVVPNVDEKLRAVGVFIYFFFRPIFSFVFAMLTVIMVKSGIGWLAEGEGLKQSFFYLSIIIGFLVGYSSGDYIDKLESVGKTVVSKVTDIKL